MFERFTDRARRVLVLAQEESRLLRHDHIAPEHILMGLLLEGDGVAAQALQSLDVTVQGARGAVLGLVSKGPRSTTGSPPFTTAAKRVLEQSLREAMDLDCEYIGTEHLLLGLVRDEGGVANAVLEALGTGREAVRQAVLKQLALLDALPAVHAEDVAAIDSPLDPSQLLMPIDVEEALLEHRQGGAVKRGERTFGEVRYLESSYQPAAEPTVGLAVAAAQVTASAFDRYTADLDPDLVTPVTGLGDRATFASSAGALRVLSGSTLFVLTMHPPRLGSIGLATAVARRVLARLEP